MATRDVKYGPYGHSGEPNWSVVLDSRTSLKEVIINHGFIVDGIGFVIADRITGKTTIKSSGGYGGNQSKITLKEDEYITQLSGLHGQYYSSPTIGSLTIHTNLCPGGYGPYGQAKNLINGIRFSSPVLSDDGWIVEFFGRHGPPYLQSIGVSVRKGDVTENVKGDVKYGPYGHSGEPNWSVVLDSRTSLKEVIINHGYIVDGIGFVIADRITGKTTTKSSGGYGGDQSKISLKEDEYITQLSGLYGQYNSRPTIGSLTIHTNICPDGYGPYGQAKNLTYGTRFSSPALSDNDWIVEFFGRHGAPYLQSIGISVRKGDETLIENPQGDVKYGPYGHSGEPNWSVMLDSRTSLKEVIINHGYIVDGIGFVIADRTGKTTIKSSGGYGGNQSKITLKEDEYITQLSGLHGQYYSSPTIGSLTIHTNLCPGGYGPYGQAKNLINGIRFSSPVLSDDGWIVEFFGRHGPPYLQSIGVYVRKGDETVIENPQEDVKYGPYGHWADPNWSAVLDSRTSVKEVIIYHEHIVDGIGFVIVDRNGKTTIKSSSGGYLGNQSKITLKEDEYITQLSGLYGHYNSRPTIGSLTIHTNLCPGGYGPYGQAKNLTNGTRFSSPALSDGDWIVEFFGRHGAPYLQSIGVSVRKA